MRHYWILGLFGLSLYFVAKFATGDGLFNRTHVVSPTIQVVTSEQSGDFEWEGSLRGGHVVEVKGINGKITAQPARNGEVHVVAHKESRRSDVSTVRVAVVEHGDGVTFCAVYPNAREENVCAPGDGGHLGSKKNDVKVNFTVYVPDGVTFVGTTVNGGVDVEGLASDVRLKTVNGSIRVGTSGAAEANTMNGSITAVIESDDRFGGVDFKTMNGSIKLTLPDDISAEFSGGTMNGSISSEFPLTISGTRGPRKLSGVIGAGGEMIRVESMNGSVRILKGN